MRENDLGSDTRTKTDLADDLYGVVYRLDADGCVSFINAAGLEVLEQSENEVVGRHFSEFLPEEERDQTISHYAGCIQSQQETDYYEVSWRSSSGVLTHFGQYTRFKYDKGRFEEATVIAHCITQQKEAIEAQKTTNQRLRRLVASLDDAILVEDEYSQIHLINQKFCDLFAIPLAPEALQGADCSQAAEQAKGLFKDPEGFITRISELLKKRERVIGEVIEMADGRIVERSYIPVYLDRDYKGHLWRYSDVSDRYQVQRRLEEQEEKYRKILENMNLGILEVDNDDRIVRVYDAMERLTGYTEEELIGKRASEVFIPLNRDPGMAEKLLARKEKKSEVYSATLQRKDGAHVEVLISGAPIVHKGEVVGSIGIHYDVTELIMVQRDLQIAKQHAEDAQRQERQLRHRITQELKLPLAAMRTMTHGLSDAMKHSMHASSLRLIRDTGELLHQTIEEGFDPVGGVEDRTSGRAITDIASLCATLVGVIRALPQRPDVHIREEIAGEPAPRFMFRRAALFQSLLNLLGLANHLLKSGHIELGFFIEEGEFDDKRFVTFQITAEGILLHKAAAVIRSIAQAPGDLPDELSVARDLIDQLDGELVIDRENESCLTLSATFSMSVVQEDNQDKPEHDADISSLRILVFEQTVLNREYLQLLLERWGIDHQITDDPKKALSAYRTQLYDVVLADVNASEVKSGDFIASIRAFEREKNTPSCHLIGLTTFVHEDLKERLTTAGLSALMQKPFKPTTLRRTLGNLVSEQHDQSHDPFERFRQLEENYFTSTEQMLRLFDFFEEDVSVYQSESAQCLKHGDIAGLRQRIHKIRPSFGMTAMEATYKIATRIEEGIDRSSLTNEDLEILHDRMLHTLNQELGELRAFAEERRKASTPSS